MQVVIKIDEARFRDIQRIAEVQLKSNYFKTVVQLIANGTPIPDNATVCDIEQIRAEIAENQKVISETLSFDKENEFYNGKWAGFELALAIIDKYAEQEPCDDNRLYIKVYADLEPQEKAEKLYQICEEDELKEVYKELGEYCEIEPCDDVVSRQAVLEMAYDMSEIDGEHFTEPCMVVDVEDIQKLPSVRPQEQTGHCKECKYFEYDSVAKVDGVPLIVAHEICNKWGDGCKTNENGYCFMFEQKGGGE